jgi:hypothetical protein
VIEVSSARTRTVCIGLVDLPSEEPCPIVACMHLSPSLAQGPGERRNSEHQSHGSVAFGVSRLVPKAEACYRGQYLRACVIAAALAGSATWQGLAPR